ncbi:MAG TPA: mechanosensitive ion channel family protein [Gemmatimonadaceae bacterium]|nr:mechanosensitive ion channel family protein [Gemmatimonadaceae bacterium]
MGSVIYNSVLPPAALLAAALTGWAASRLFRAALRAGVRRTRASWDDAVIDRLGDPLTVAFSVGAVLFLLPFLALEPGFVAEVRRVARVVLLVDFFWAAWRIVDVSGYMALRSPWALRVPASRALVPLGARAVKVLILAVAIVASLSLFGYPVASLVAGLGIGGLALALAAQKTVENLFGAFSIGVDQPFREGDFVKIEDFVGTVEAIGLRSTRFRTLDRTIVTIPNGKLADMKLESFSERDRIRLSAIVGLVYGTTPSQLRSALAGFEAVLRAHPKIWPDAVVVRFREFAASSLDIEVMAWFLTTDWGEFQRIREDVLLQFMEVVERTGSSFAFPTRTIHLAPQPDRVG